MVRRAVSTALLQPPAARQGPGPIPQPLVEALDLAITRLVARALPGDRRAAGVGAGTELAQLRPYEIGDDVRQLDPAATARTGQPHVRLQVPERSLTTWIVLDVSPSMAFGTADRLKADVAEGVALVFGRLGVRRAGSVGLVAFGAAAPRVLPPRGAKPGIVALRRMLAEGVAPDGHQDADGLADALSASVADGAPARTRRRDQRLPRPAPAGSARWARCGSATRCSPSRSSTRARRRSRRSGTWRWSIPRPAPAIEVDTSQSPRARALRRARAPSAAKPLASELRRLRVEHVTLATDQDWLLGAGTTPAMSFASPLWLGALAADPDRDRRVRSPRAGAPGATRSGSRRCRRSRWRRPDPGTSGAGACPAALALAAIAALALALARPHVSYSAPVNQGSIMLVTDHSGSMAATDVSADPARGRRASRQHVHRSAPLEGAGRRGRLLGLARRRPGARAPTTPPRARSSTPSPPTAPPHRRCAPARAAAAPWRGPASTRRPRSCCSPTARPTGEWTSPPCARQAAQDKIPISTVALGTPDGVLPSPDPFSGPVAGSPRSAADAADRRAVRRALVQRPVADQLSSIYKQLGERLGSVTRKREVTAAFAIGGLVLLLRGTSTRWSGASLDRPRVGRRACKSSPVHEPRMHICTCREGLTQLRR